MGGGGRRGRGEQTRKPRKNVPQFGYAEPMELPASVTASSELMENSFADNSDVGGENCSHITGES